MKNLSVIATDNVYTSAENEFRLLNRSNYSQMLKLLTKVTKAENPLITNFMDENRLKFWFNQLLPLIFDKDTDIQENAIIAFEAFIPLLELLNYQNDPDWPKIKERIISYSGEIASLLQKGNANWYKIWQICIQILNKAIIKGVVINSFLTIVESGFRANISKKRAEAFLCWKTLIEVFAKQSESFTAKQIKLLCTPLKPTISKTLGIALNKYRVWWYFLCKLNALPGIYSQTILEPFLKFSFGSLGSEFITFDAMDAEKVPCKKYPQLIPMLTASLISLLGPPNADATLLLREHSMEKMENQLITIDIFKENGKRFINYATGITRFIIIENGLTNQTTIIDCIWKYLIDYISRIKVWEQLKHLIENINKMIVECEEQNKNSKLLMSIINTIGCSSILQKFTHGSELDVDIYLDAIKQFICLLPIKTMRLPYAQESQIIDNIFTFDTLKMSSNYCLLINQCVDYYCTSNDCDNSMIIRDKIWLRLADILIVNLNQLQPYYITNNDRIDSLYNYLFWPMKHNFNEISKLKTKWPNVVELIHSLDKSEFASKWSVRMLDIAKKQQCDYINELVSIFLMNLDVTFTTFENAPIDVLKHILDIINFTPITLKDLNPIIQSMAKYISKLNGDQLLIVYPIISAIMKNAEKEIVHLRVDRVHINDCRRTLIEKLNAKCMLEKINQLTNEQIKKELLNLIKCSNDEFVVIHNTWKFIPDKLTEHQKEKLKEKRKDTRALFNCASQSEDSVSLQAWTPNISLLPNNNDGINITSNDKKIAEVENPGQMRNIEKKINHTNRRVTFELNRIKINMTEGKPLTINSDKSRLRKKTESSFTAVRNRNIKKMKLNVKAIPQLPAEILVTTESVEKKENIDLNITSDIVEPSQKSTVRRVSKRSLRFEGNSSNKCDDLKNIPEENQRILQPSISIDTKTDQVNSDLIDETCNIVENEFEKKDIAVSDTELINTQLLEDYNLITENVNVIGPFKESNENNISVATNLTVQENDLQILDLTGDTAEDLAFISIAEINRQIQRPNDNIIKNGKEAEKNKLDENEANIIVDMNKVQPTQLETSTDSFELSDTPSKLNRTIATSPNVIDVEQRNNDLLNNTIDISPILEKTTPPSKFDGQLNNDNIDVLDKTPTCHKMNDETPKRYRIPCSTPISIASIARSSGARSLKIMSLVAADTLTTQSTAEILPARSLTATPTSTLSTAAAAQIKSSATIPASELSLIVEPECSTKITRPSTIGPYTQTAQARFSLIPTTAEASTITLVSSTTEATSGPSRTTVTSASSITVTNPAFLSVAGPSIVAAVSSTITSAAESLSTINAAGEASTTESLTTVVATTASSTSVISAVESSIPVTTNCSSAIINNKFISRSAKLLNLVNSTSSSQIHYKNKLKFLTETTANEQSSVHQQQQQLPIISTKETKSTMNDFDVITEQSQHFPGTSINKEFLTFSKIIPSSLASPPLAILKRKHADISADEGETTPVQKRKRVNFRDPPVSETKEFIVNLDEYPTKQNTISLFKGGEFDDISTISPRNVKLLLKRKSRADSMIDIAKFTRPSKLIKSQGMNDENMAQFNRSSGGSGAGDINEETDVAITKSIAGHDLMVNGLIGDVGMDEEIIVTPSPPLLTFNSKEAALKYILEEYSLKDYLTNYLAIHSNSSTNFTKKICNLLTDKQEIRSNLMEELSEKYPQEFLQHAIRENLSSTICDQLSMDTLLEYIKSKAKSFDNNADILQQIRQHFGDILKTICEKDLNEQCENSVPANNNTDYCAQLTLNRALQFITRQAETQSTSSCKQMIVDSFCSIFNNSTNHQDRSVHEAFHKNLLQIFSTHMSYEQVFEYLNVICKIKSREKISL